MIYLKEMTNDEESKIERLYIEAFPAGERKPFSMLLRMRKKQKAIIGGLVFLPRSLLAAGNHRLFLDKSTTASQCIETLLCINIRARDFWFLHPPFTEVTIWQSRACPFEETLIIYFFSIPGRLLNSKLLSVVIC